MYYIHMHHQRESGVKFLNYYRIINNNYYTNFFFAVIKKIYSCIFQIFKQYAIIWYRKRFLPSRRLIVNLPNVNDLHIPIYFQRMAKEIDFWGLMLVF